MRQRGQARNARPPLAAGEDRNRGAGGVVVTDHLCAKSLGFQQVQRGLPIQLLVKNFTQVGEMWQIAPDVRAMVQFRPLNLLRDFSSLGMMDVVFCRNVLIYFDRPTQERVVRRLVSCLRPGGYLFLGHSESIAGIDLPLVPVANTVFRRN